MIKKIFISVLSLLLVYVSNGQIIPRGTPNYTPQGNANTTSGFLGTIQAGYGIIDAIYQDTASANAAPQDGKSKLLFNIGTRNPVAKWYRDTTINAWIQVSTVGSGGNSWSLTGNTGTNPSINFLGTTDDNDLVFKRDGIPSGIISTNNTSFGLSALGSNGSGMFNTAMGVAALAENNTGNNNTAVGRQALILNTGGGNNTSIGYKSLSNNMGGIGNTAIGYESILTNQSGNYNIGIGYNAGISVNAGVLNNSISLGTNDSVTKSYQFSISDSVKYLHFKNLDSATGTSFNLIGRDVNGDWHVYQNSGTGLNQNLSNTDLIQTADRYYNVTQKNLTFDSALNFTLNAKDYNGNGDGIITFSSKDVTGTLTNAIATSATQTTMTSNSTGGNNAYVTTTALDASVQIGSSSGNIQLLGLDSLPSPRNILWLDNDTIRVGAYPVGGSGTVTSVSSGSLSPLFTTTISNATTTPSFSFAPQSVLNHTVYGSVGGGTPAFITPDSTLVQGLHTQPYYDGRYAAIGVSGSVTNVGTGYGLTGGPITTTGTITADTTKLIPYTDTSKLAGIASQTFVKTQGFIKNITGLVTQGTNVTVTGSGTGASPYVINSISSGGGIADSTFFWKLNGNKGTSGSSVLGTTTPVTIDFITGNAKRMRIDSVGLVGIGTGTSALIFNLLVNGSSTTSSVVNSGAGFNSYFANSIGGTVNNYFGSAGSNGSFLTNAIQSDLCIRVEGHGLNIGTNGNSTSIMNFPSSNGKPTIFNNMLMTRAGTSFIEFSNTSLGGTVKSTVGQLGSPEANLSCNMDYTNGGNVHKFYDSTVNAMWLAVGPVAWQIQVANSGSNQGDVFLLNGGQRYLQKQFFNGSMFINDSFVNTPNAASRPAFLTIPHATGRESLAGKFGLTLTGDTTSTVSSPIILNANNTGGVLIAGGGGITSFGSGQKFQISGSGSITKWNNVPVSLPATQGAAGTTLINDGSGNLLWKSVPLIVASNFISAQSAAANITTYTTGTADSSYEVSAYVNVTVLTANIVQCTVTYTDETNVSRTATLFPMGATSATLALGNSNFSVFGEFRAKASTAITVAVTDTGAGIATYNAGATIKKTHP